MLYTTETISFYNLKKILGFFDRLFFKKNIKTDYKYLNIGCGKNIISNFENIDFYSLKFWDNKKVTRVDLNYKLPFFDNSFEGCICEHVLEHFSDNEVIFILKEVRRVIKKKAIFRIIVPDLKKYIDYYNSKNKNTKFGKFILKADAISHLTQKFGHKTCFDFEKLKFLLKKSGFNNILKKTFKSGDNKLYKFDTSGRNWNSLYVEAKK
jgi:hypothetical protein